MDARAAWNRAGTSLTITCDVRPDYKDQHCVNGDTAYAVGIRARNAAGAGGRKRSLLLHPAAHQTVQ